LIPVGIYPRENGDGNDYKINSIMSIFKQKKFYFILVILLVAGWFGYSQYQKSQLPPVYDTVKVERGTLLQTVDATGQIESAQDLSLKFEIPGMLSSLRVKEGDSVRVGQLLANLRLTELNTAIAQAQANLNKQLAGSTPEYISQLQSNLDKAKNDLMQAKGNGNSVEESKLVQNVYDNLVAILQSVQVVLSTSLTSADNILGIDNNLANATFVSNLGVNSTMETSYLNPAKTQYHLAKQAKNIFDLSANAITKNSLHTEIDQTAEKGEAAMLVMKDCLFYVSGVLDTTPPGGSLTQAALDIMKTNIQTARTTLSTKYATIVDQIHDVITARNTYYSYQTLVEKAQAALADAANPPREVDVASYRAALDQTIASREKASIKAPIDGIITQVNIKVGESVNGSEIAFKLLSPHYEIKVDVSETDIAKVQLGDSVAITLDAFSDDVKFSGKVINIDPGATIIQDVVYYKVKISLNDSDKPVKPGMTANVIIKTDTRENALLIPSRAVRTNGIKSVNILENNLEKKVEIKLGIKGNDGKVEVLEGLNEGQLVILGVQTK